MSMYQPYEGDGWCVGYDFDPSDPDEMEVMEIVWEKERLSRMELLERENVRLHNLLAQLQEEDE